MVAVGSISTSTSSCVQHSPIMERTQPTDTKGWRGSCRDAMRGGAASQSSPSLWAFCSPDVHVHVRVVFLRHDCYDDKMKSCPYDPHARVAGTAIRILRTKYRRTVRRRWFLLIRPLPKRIRLGLPLEQRWLGWRVTDVDHLRTYASILTLAAAHAHDGLEMRVVNA